MELISENRIKRQLSEEKYHLLGQLPVSDEDYNRLIRYTKNIIPVVLQNGAPLCNLMLSTALVQIAIRYYQNGNYWKYFRHEMERSGLEENLTSANLNLIGQSFVQTIRMYSLFEMKRQKNAPQPFVENIKAHAFVTDSYADGFFDFAMAFYEDNLFRQLDADLVEDIASLSRFMETTLELDGDTLAAGQAGEKAGKTYKLLKSTRTVFAHANLNQVYSMFYPVLQMLDRQYYENELPCNCTDRFSELFCRWCQNRADHDERGRAAVHGRRIFNHRPVLKMDLGYRRASLIIPPQKFNELPEDVRAEVIICTDRQELKFPLELYRSFGMYISEELTIPVADIFAEINVRIQGAEERAYRFHRTDYRIFNSSWENVTRFGKGENNLLVRPEADVTCNKPEKLLYQMEVLEIGRLYLADIADDTVCYISGRAISIGGEFSAEPVFDRLIHYFSVTDKQGRALKAAREHPYISAVVPTQKYNGSSLIINGVRKPLRSIAEKTVYLWPEDSTKTVVSIALLQILPDEDGIYRIQMDVPGESIHDICSYVLLKKLKCRQARPKYIYSSTGTASFQTDGYDLRFPEQGGEITETPDGLLYTFPITAETDSISFEIELSGERCRICTPVYIFLYGASRDQMRADKIDTIWYADLPYTLYIRLRDAKEMYAVLKDRPEIQCAAESIGEDLLKIDMTPLIDLIREEPLKRWRYLYLYYEDHGRRRIELTSIQRQPEINPYYQLKQDDGLVYMDLDIQGKADLYLTIKDKWTQEIVVEDRRLETGRNSFPELLPDGLYSFFPSMEEEDEFGLCSERTKLQPVKKIGVVNRQNLTGCRLNGIRLLLQDEEVCLEEQYFIKIFKWEEPGVYQGGLYRVQDRTINGVVCRSNNFPYYYGEIKIEGTWSDDRFVFHLYMWSKREHDWIEPYYDSTGNRILGCDDPQPDKDKDYERYVILFEEESAYEVCIENIRRTQ